jgi:two-component system chemotaxis response regulator CheY
MTPEKVLVVDDSLITINKLSRILEELGHEVVGTARNGADAIKVYADVTPTLVTMDITMPTMDGIEATRRIIALDPNARVVVVTSHGQERMVLDAVDAGAQGYIVKPIKPAKITTALLRLSEEPNA